MHERLDLSRDWIVTTLNSVYHIADGSFTQVSSWDWDAGKWEQLAVPQVRITGVTSVMTWPGTHVRVTGDQGTWVTSAVRSVRPLIRLVRERDEVTVIT